MKVFEAAALLVLGTVLLTFVSIAFLLFPRPLSLSNPTLFMEGLCIAGLAFLALATRKLLRISRAVSTCTSSVTGRQAEA